MPTLHTLTLRLAAERADLREALTGLLDESALRVGVLRLAAARPDLRPRLLDLLEKTAVGNTSVIQQPPIVISQPPIVVQQEAPPAAPPTPMFIQQPAAPPVVDPTFQGNPVLVPAPLPVPPPVAGPVPSSPVTLGLINEKTRAGFASDIEPELVRMVATGMSREQAAGQMIAQINDAFQQKTHLYNVLILHQSTFETDDVFREGLVKSCQVWMSEGSLADGRG